MSRLAIYALLPAGLVLGAVGVAADPEAPGHIPILRWSPPDSSFEPAGPVREIGGPDARHYPAFSPGSRAAQFDGKGSRLRLPAPDSSLRFSNGDSITIEAWIRLDRISNDRNQYIIGKGRTHRPGFPRDNQNWALRLRGVGGEARVSFLFRSEDTNDGEGAYHRWNSEFGIRPGKRWHHVAVRYEFGAPKSIRAVINGRSCGGSWDMGGPTGRAPASDDDEVWIGSAQGGTPANSFHGAMARIAVYRECLAPALLAARFHVNRKTPPPDLSGLAADRVLLEVFRSDEAHSAWPFLLDAPVRRLEASAFAMFRLPPTYGTGGRRLEQDGTHLMRLAAHAALPAGEHEILLRAPGLARLTINGEEVARLGPATRGPDAHGKLRPEESFPYPRTRLGTSEAIVSHRSAGAPALVVLEGLAGVARGKPQVGEFLVATRRHGSEWALLTPGAPVPFEAKSLERYRTAEREDFDRQDTEQRRRLAEEDAAVWRDRHEQARRHIRSLPAVAVPPLPQGHEARNAVDHFLADRMARVRPRTPGGETAHPDILPLLEQKCLRCHGAKAKGGLRLDSRDAALAGGDSGPAIDPGEAAGSLLLERVLSQDPDERMPPKGDRLAEKELAAVRSWIEAGAPWEERSGAIHIPPPLDELAFLRRLHLDTVGVFPSPDEIAAYLADSSPDRTARWIDRLVGDPRHADHWVSYWQDVFAENPLLVKPTRNNTGPFRWWLHEALLDNMPFDRFVSELVTFSGGSFSGGAAGFKVATDNDVPMAAKAHTIGTAFLGLEMQCARCHDAPFHSATQKDLFSIAAMLRGTPLRVPASSTVPATFFAKLGGRKPRITVSLDPETPVAPEWPFPVSGAPREPEPVFDHPSEELAHQITRPENRRFARVVVNRLWKRYFGEGIVEPADDWEGHDPSHPELLDFLAREFVTNGYDLHHVSRLILNSAAYRRAPLARAPTTISERFFEAPLRRRLTAEQLVDSLFAATGTPVYSEELTLDVEGWHPHSKFLNLGRPRRAWEFVSLSTERDRPSLTLPHAASIVSLMDAYGWRPDRSDPLTDRRTEPNVLQAGMLANGLAGIWWTRLSDFSDITKLAVEAASVDDLIKSLYLRLLTRRPSERERVALHKLLAPEFDARLARPPGEFTKDIYVPGIREISWSNHLHPEATTLAQELEDEAAAGPAATDFITPGWREKMEDVVWALINSPEIQFVP